MVPLQTLQFLNSQVLFPGEDSVYEKGGHARRLA